jgi:hypothetical protein
VVVNLFIEFHPPMVRTNFAADRDHYPLASACVRGSEGFARQARGDHGGDALPRVSYFTSQNPLSVARSAGPHTNLPGVRP